MQHYAILLHFIWVFTVCKNTCVGFPEYKELTGTLANSEDDDALEKSWLKYRIKPQMFVRCSIMYERVLYVARTWVRKTSSVEIWSVLVF